MGNEKNSLPVKVIFNVFMDSNLGIYQRLLGSENGKRFKKIKEHG
jgi:hypothetical protein